MKRIVLFAIGSAATAFCSCNSGDGKINVAGNWSGAATKTSDTCVASTAPLTPNFTHFVTQDNIAVVLLNEIGVQFAGYTISGSGFSVNASTSDVTSCTGNSTIEYQNINSDNDPTADIEMTIDRTCPGESVCKIIYSGTATRSVPPPGTPLSDSGCLAVTSAASYAGDGGCGISNVAYSTREQNGGEDVVLEPFGTNGSTSFVVDPDNTFAGQSNNTNLTIFGVTGSSCSMACSPPDTFSVSCFVNNGTACIEKFQ